MLYVENRSAHTSTSDTYIAFRHINSIRYMICYNYEYDIIKVFLAE